MSHHLNAILLVCVALTAIGCVEALDDGDAVHGSRQIVTVDERRADFDEVEIGSAFDATITRADAYSVSIRVDDNVIDHLRVSRSGDTLRVALDDDHFYRDVTLEADITLPSINRLSLSGASRASVTGFHTNDGFDVELSGASSAAIDLSAGDVDCELSGASVLTMAGSGGDLRLQASGAGRAALGDFTVRDLDADLSGASSAVVRATGTISATLSGASLLEYHGSPALGDISASSGSTVSKID